MPSLLQVKLETSDLSPNWWGMSPVDLCKHIVIGGDITLDEETAEMHIPMGVVPTIGPDGRPHVDIRSMRVRLITCYSCFRPSRIRERNLGGAYAVTPDGQRRQMRIFVRCPRCTNVMIDRAGVSEGYQVPKGTTGEAMEAAAAAYQSAPRGARVAAAYEALRSALAAAPDLTAAAQGAAAAVTAAIETGDTASVEAVPVLAAFLDAVGWAGMETTNRLALLAILLTLLDIACGRLDAAGQAAADREAAELKRQEIELLEEIRDALADDALGEVPVVSGPNLRKSPAEERRDSSGLAEVRAEADESKDPEE